MSDDEMMRRALLRKIQDPEWMADQERRYENIVGSAAVHRDPPAANYGWVTTSVPISFDDVGSMSAEEEPTTIDGLWMGNWQRSTGAYTVTRYPDETIHMDYPDGHSAVYKPCRSAGHWFSWAIDEHDAGGRIIATRRVREKHRTAEEALFQMHRSVLTEFDEIVAANPYS